MKYSGYDWIKVKKYKMDESKSWEDRYKELETHHIEETTFLIDELRKYEEKVNFVFDQFKHVVVGTVIVSIGVGAFLMFCFMVAMTFIER